MTQTKHTPGPWVSRHNGYYYDIKTKKSVCSFAYTVSCFDSHDGNLSKKEVETANANLIAAAPELLEALQDAVIGVKWHADTYPDTHSDADIEFLEKAQAAISKATAN